MRLLIVTPCHAVHGGVERIIESLSRQLPGHGIEVIVGLAAGSRFNDPAVFRREYPCLRCVEIDGRTGRRIGRVDAIEQIIAQLRPEIVLVARIFDAYEAIVRRKLAGDHLRVAVTIQAYEPEYIADLSRYAAFVDLCVTSGKLIADAVASYTDLPRERVRSIPGGIREPHRLRRPSSCGALRIGYVGRIESSQKRILDIVPFAQILATLGIDFSMRIVGTGPAAAELNRAISSSNVRDRFIVEGWMSQDQLYENVYPELDVVVHFAGWEGITIAPREAMAHGVVPVVSRFLGCLAEREFEDGVNALTFAVGDVKAAAGLVRELAVDRHLMERLSAAAIRSQGGVRSEGGAAAAWAESFRAALRSVARIGSERPDLPWPPPGRLERLGVGSAAAEWIRRVMRRKMVHDDAGAEWPHVSGLYERGLLAEITRYGRSTEESEAAVLRRHAE